jgi:type VI secretion system secreted protein Hcp
MKKLLLVLSVLATIVIVSPADAALNAYLKLKGQKTGQIQGSTTQMGREGQIEVVAFEHTVKVDPGAKAKQHGVFTITKAFDKSSPILAKLMATQEPSEFELQLWRPAATGKEVQYYTIKLTNARITQINFKQLNNKFPENMKHEQYEEIAFTYESITWTFNDGGITYSDAWGSAVRPF